MLSDSIATGGGTNLISSLNAAALAQRPFTVVRTHLFVSLTSDQVSATEDQIGAIGMAVVSEQASAIGINSMPTPVVDIDSDLFFVHQILVSSLQVASNAGVNPQFQTNFQIDSKAMRKVNEDEDVVMTLESLSGVSDGLAVITGGRMLVKLH